MHKNPESGLQIVTKYLEGKLGPLPPDDPGVVPISPLIAHETGVPLSAVKSAVGHLRSIQLLPHPASVEESRQRLSAAKSYNPKLAEEWLSIHELALMGMSPREIHWALIFDQQLNIPDHILRQRIYVQTKRKKFKREDEGYERSVHETVLSVTDEEIKGRVRLWLDVRKIFKEQRLDSLPNKRLDWIWLINQIKTAEELQQGDIRNLTLDYLGRLRYKLRAASAQEADRSEERFRYLQIIEEWVASKDPLTSQGSKVRLTGGQIGIVEGRITRGNGITYIRVRLSEGVEDVPSSNGKKEQVVIRFGEDTFRDIPVAFIHERAALIPQKETNSLFHPQF